MAVIEEHEVSAQFDELIERALAGEEIVVSRDGKPVVRLEPVAERVRRAPVLGIGKDTLTLVEGWDDPMSEEELAEWYGDD